MNAPSSSARDLSASSDPVYQDVFDLEKHLQQRWAFQNGVLQGTSLMYDPEGHVVEELPFEEGKLQGTSKAYDAQGRALRELPYEHGQLHGEAHFYQNGVLSMSMNYIHGQPEGPCMMFYPHQQKQMEITYQKGLIHGVMRHFSPQGAVTYRCPYEHGIKHGVEEIFYPETGQPLSRTSFDQGFMEGESLWFYPNGAVQKKTFYKKGQIIEGPFLYDTKGRPLKT